MLNADKEMENELREAYLGGCPRMPFSQTLRYAKKIILGILTICLR